ncbi:hypothetical protein TUSST3_14250 [Streptomyces sp. TUS-ST3]|nr:hypothetical protein TUSST3_14250 [Streptomyces sp. TUS-ST3]
MAPGSEHGLLDDVLGAVHVAQGQSLGELEQGGAVRLIDHTREGLAPVRAFSVLLLFVRDHRSIVGVVDRLPIDSRLPFGGRPPPRVRRGPVSHYGAAPRGVLVPEDNPARRDDR